MVRAWSGLAFEQVCFNHLKQIKNALGIGGVYSTSTIWHNKEKNNQKGSQIDLVIDRRDGVINLFEIKFSINPFTITKSYDLNLRTKTANFREIKKTSKDVFLTKISTFGLTKNEYSRSIIQNEITMDDLFKAS